MFFKKKTPKKAIKRTPKITPLDSFPDTTDAGTPFRNEIEKELYFTDREYKQMKDEDDRFTHQYQDHIALGIEAEEAGDIEEAIEEYEASVAAGFNGSHPYKRLAILYRRQKKYDDEIRVLKTAVKVFSKNASKAGWFNERLKKVQELKIKG